MASLSFGRRIPSRFQEVTAREDVLEVVYNIIGSLAGSNRTSMGEPTSGTTSPQMSMFVDTVIVPEELMSMVPMELMSMGFGSST